MKFYLHKQHFSCSSTRHNVGEKCSGNFQTNSLYLCVLCKEDEPNCSFNIIYWQEPEAKLERFEVNIFSI
jgi:hypothetical protein